MKKAKRGRMMTPREYAKLHNVAYTTVMNWLQNNLIQGARKEPLPPPFVGHFYQIPEGAAPPELKPGPKPKPKEKTEKKGKENA